MFFYPVPTMKKAVVRSHLAATASILRRRGGRKFLQTVQKTFMIPLTGEILIGFWYTFIRKKREI